MHDAARFTVHQIARMTACATYLKVTGSTPSLGDYVLCGPQNKKKMPYTSVSSRKVSIYLQRTG